MEKIILGADASGFDLKEVIKAHMEKNGYEIIDIGMYSIDKDIPYYEVAAKVAAKIQSGEAARAILFCGTGMGVSIVANKFKGVYASVVESDYTGKMAKIINNSNVLCLGGKIVSDHKAKITVDLWLGAEHTKGFWNPDPKIAQFLKDSLVEIAKIEDKNFK
jgi:ribose 5-phosphate isomerase B